MKWSGDLHHFVCVCVTKITFVLFYASYCIMYVSLYR